MHALWKNSCSFSRDLAHETRWISSPFISLQPSKSTGKTQLDILRDMIVQIIPLSYDLLREIKIS